MKQWIFDFATGTVIFAGAFALFAGVIASIVWVTAFWGILYGISYLIGLFAMLMGGMFASRDRSKDKDNDLIL